MHANDTNSVVFNMLRDIRDTQLEQAESLGKMAGQIDSLAGAEGRVTKLESAQTRQWWFTFAIAPVLMIAKGIVNHFGVKI
jgi:hypothetical protein